MKILGEMTALESSIFFLYGKIPGIELCKIFIWADKNSDYIHIQVFIESAKLRGMLDIKLYPLRIRFVVAFAMGYLRLEIWQGRKEERLCSPQHKAKLLIDVILCT